MMKTYEEFTGKYGVSKTLCFELIPQGKTLENMKAKGVLEEDEHRAESYQKVKAMIDECHKRFIEEALKETVLCDLDKYYEYYKILNRDENEKTMFEDIQEDLRTQIVLSFKMNPMFKKMFGKELFTEVLPGVFKDAESSALLDEFKGFTTYFWDFNIKRGNIYTDEAISTAIGYRLIHENLPLFIQNMHLYQKIKESPICDVDKQLMEDLGEFLAGNKVEDYFTLDGFNLTLTQKGISQYNLLIGGYSKEKGVKVKGLNEYINLYNQTAGKADRLGKLKPLKKQILSDKESFSFVVDKFENDEEVIKAISDYWQILKPIVGDADNLYAEKSISMMNLFFNLREFNLERIYLRSDFVKTLSQKMFGDWSLISQAMNVWYDANYTGLRKVRTKAYEQEKEKYFKNKESYSIAFLNNCCKYLKETKNGHVERYFERYCDEQQKNFALALNELEKEMKEFVAANVTAEDSKKAISRQKDAVHLIKAFLDEIIEYQHFLKPFMAKIDGLDYDYDFYDAFSAMYEKVSDITTLYNKVRNYITKKPYSKEKIKLNFSNAALLSGWSLSKEVTNASVILQKDGLYYLGIIDKSSKKIFEGNYPSNGEAYEKMEYRLLPGANKMLPKVFLAAKNAIDKYQPSDEIFRIYKNGTFKKGNGFSIDDCHTLIDYFKDCLKKHEDWSKFGFEFSDTKSYADISGFYREVEAQGYQIIFRNVSKDYIDQLVEEGKLYLFQIYNKDFSPYSKGTPNLHTMYFKAVFAPENLNDVVYKLNGDAEIFYRKRSIAKENMITHPANLPVANKNPLNPKKESLFDYTLYKDKRYTVDKFMFHVPVTMNFKANGTGRMNADVNRVIKYNDNNYVIGINRGERHLLYVTVIDSDGNIVEDYSLNEIVNEYKGMAHRTNYHNLLEDKAKERDSARKNWESIENIKELKEGYLSQAIHKITQLMIKYQAVVVIEDLNFGFLRGRQAIEKNIYQKFVKMLIDKLNYYVDKKIDENMAGGLYHAYQLTNKFESFKRLGKQCGFIFFAPSYYVSNIDPTTGFVNLLYPRYENMTSAKDFFSKFEDIYYDAEKDYFCFDVDYAKFTEKAKGTKERWTICSHGDRVHSFRNPDKNMMWDLEVVYPTQMFKDVFDRYSIPYENVEKGTVKEAILAQTEKSFFVDVMKALELTLQMRNFDTEIDYVVSPVLNKNGEFFDSRDGIVGLPTNVEANGAYNIARKGLWMIEKIRETEDGMLGKERLAMSNEDWLRFAQNV